MRNVGAGIGTEFRFVALASSPNSGCRPRKRIRVEDEAPAHHARDGQTGFGLGENPVWSQPRLGDGLLAGFALPIKRSTPSGSSNE